MFSKYLKNTGFTCFWSQYSISYGSATIKWRSFKRRSVSPVKVFDDGMLIRLTIFGSLSEVGNIQIPYKINSLEIDKKIFYFLTEFVITSLQL